MEVPNAATENRLEVVIDIEKKYGASESMGNIPSEHSLIIPIPVEEGDADFDFICESIIDDSHRWYEGVGWI